jgi:hypothetical protein
MPSRSRPAGAVKHGLFLDSCRLIGNRFWPSGALARSLKPKACGSTWWEDVANSVDGRDGAGAVDANAAVAIALQRLEPNAPAHDEAGAQAHSRRRSWAGIGLQRSLPRDRWEPAVLKS